eukprot:CAMPEP_0172611118 /NCGR_PEP_ID=MMETSP1068-20121228/30845_1 /TAXON_ID=35684 /ORGANISM="Pseudopedinella elastica, Strain CCMP716" /LENGTH=30 /DNA_ID= /DNA_START= /DNA_END= /DNA_ORIENTATION=
MEPRVAKVTKVDEQETPTHLLAKVLGTLKR